MRIGMAWQVGRMGLVEDLKCAPSLHGRVVHNATPALHVHYAITCVVRCPHVPSKQVHYSSIPKTPATRNITMHATESRSHYRYKQTKMPACHRERERNFTQYGGHLRDKLLQEYEAAPA